MPENDIGHTGNLHTGFSTQSRFLEINQKFLKRNLPFFSVNSAFTTLRLLIPTEPKNRKLSKIETLRLAKSYIAHLGAILVTG